MPSRDYARVYVWDSFVRVFHWTLAGAFSTVFIKEDDALLTGRIWCAPW